MQGRDEKWEMVIMEQKNLSAPVAYRATNNAHKAGLHREEN
jgi:hypothetical protein